nr:hypothetical protein Iba_chr07bCG9110 [Ipomoea batatas]
MTALRMVFGACKVCRLRLVTASSGFGWRWPPWSFASRIIPKEASWIPLVDVACISSPCSRLLNCFFIDGDLCRPWRCVLADKTPSIEEAKASPDTKQCLWGADWRFCLQAAAHLWLCLLTFRWFSGGLREDGGGINGMIADISSHFRWQRV